MLMSQCYQLPLLSWHCMFVVNIYHNVVNISVSVTIVTMLTIIIVALLSTFSPFSCSSFVSIHGRSIARDKLSSVYTLSRYSLCSQLDYLKICSFHIVLICLFFLSSKNPIDDERDAKV